MIIGGAGGAGGEAVAGCGAGAAAGAGAGEGSLGAGACGAAMVGAVGWVLAAVLLDAGVDDRGINTQATAPSATNRAMPAIQIPVRLPPDA